MKHAEIIYETGDKSVVSYDDISELVSGITEQHRRAMNGLDAGPQTGRPAERVARVLLYDEHPADAFASTISVSDLAGLASSLNVGGEVSHNELVTALAQHTSPVVPVETNRHDSMFKAKEVSEMSSDIWSGE